MISHSLSNHYDRLFLLIYYFIFNHTPTTEIYTLSLHDALPIFCRRAPGSRFLSTHVGHGHQGIRPDAARPHRSEEHTSELQSRRDLVCRLLLEKKKSIMVLSSY